MKRSKRRQRGTMLTDIDWSRVSDEQLLEVLEANHFLLVNVRLLGDGVGLERDTTTHTPGKPCPAICVGNAEKLAASAFISPVMHWEEC
jgi:hypothetical protein